MLYHLLYPLKAFWFPFNVFRYITFRAGAAFITALIFSFIFTPFITRKLKNWQTGIIREYVPERHKKKEGTPSMGGLGILIILVFTTLLWCRLDNQIILNLLATITLFGAIGFADDYVKLKNKKGLKAWQKFVLQWVAALGSSFWIYSLKLSKYFTYLSLPFIDHPVLNMGPLYPLFAAFVIVAAANAVNLTDGLDGLAISSVGTVAAAFAGFAYLAGHINFAKYLKIIYVPGAGELTIFLAGLVGASLGFLWFNTFPAQIFMGDVGSMSLGAALGFSAVASKQEILLAIAGGIFVLEVVSVILQVAYFKLKGRRIFLMAPIHHHFELAGWEEPTIIVRFWIITIILSTISYMLLKLR